MYTLYLYILLGASKVLWTRSEMKSATNSKGWCFEARRCLFEYPSTSLRVPVYEPSKDPYEWYLKMENKSRLPGSNLIPLV